MSHPDSIALEAFACGEASPKTAAHVDACAECRAFVDRARGLAATPPALDVARALRSVATDEAQRPRGAVVRLLTFAPVALAAAAALVLWIRARPVEIGPAPVAPSPAARAPEGPTLAPETRFKGGAQVAVVRERGAAQERFTGSVTVKPGDRLRVEVALDRTQAILAAVLGDDGSWLELMPETTRDAGTHFSERSARIDEQPLSGTVVVGPPDAVRRARAVHDLSGVTAVRVVWEAR